MRGPPSSLRLLRTRLSIRNLLVAFPEELTATALQNLVYMQQVLDLPGPVATKSGFAQLQNEELVARPTRERGTDLVLYRSNGLLFPGNPRVSLKDFGAYAKTFYPKDGLQATSGNAELAADLAAIAEPGQMWPTKPNFDQATLKFIDQNQPFSACDLVRIANALKLAPVGPHAPRRRRCRSAIPRHYHRVRPKARRPI